MAITGIIDGVRITDAESITNWSTYKFDGGGGGASAAEIADGFIQGTAAVGFTYSSANKAFMACYDYVAAGGTARNFNSGGNSEDKYVYIWANPLFSMHSTGNLLTMYGSLGIALSDNATLSNSWAIWSLYGVENYPGGWQKLILDPTKRPTASGGTWSDGSLSAVRQFGVCYNFTAGKGGPQAIWVDAIDIASNITLYGSGTENNSWGDAIVFEEETPANVFGLFKSLDAGKNIIEVQTDLRIGLPQGSGIGTKFSDIDRTIVFKEPYYITSSGTFDLAVPNTYASITINGSNTSGGITSGLGTDARFGILVEAADPDEDTGRNGMTVIGSSRDYLTDFRFGSNSLTTEPIYQLNANRSRLRLYGCNFRNLRRSAQVGIGLDPNYYRWYASGGDECLGTSFDNCFEMIFDSGVRVRDCTFLNSQTGQVGDYPYAAMTLTTLGDMVEAEDSQVVILDIKNSKFLSNNFAIRVNNAFSGTYTLDNCTFSDNLYDFRYEGNYTGTINLTNGSNASTEYSPNPGGLIDLVNAVTLTLTNIQSGSEVRIRPSGDTSIVLFSEENVVGGESEYTYQYPPIYSGVDIFVMKVPNYKWFSLTNYTLGAASTDLYISQIPDRTYDNP